MKVSYKLNSKIDTFGIDRNYEKDINFLLTNNKGDFLNLGAQKNSTKFQGLNICNSKTLEIFKTIDEIIPLGIEIKNVLYTGFKVRRFFNSKSETGKETSDSFYLGPTGGIIYEISNFNGNVKFDLDMKKQNDFDDWGRKYTTYKKKGILIIKYTKQGDDDYEMYLGVKSNNFSYELKENWEKKEYEYSKRRNSGFIQYVYNIFDAKITNSNQKIIIGAGFSENEVLNQIELLEKHEDELKAFDKNIIKDLISNITFEKPVSQDLMLSYKISINAIYNFWNKNLDRKDLTEGIYAGIPWFAQIWARDELVCLRSFINNHENSFFKNRLYYYLEKLNPQTGLLKRIDFKDSHESCDGVFWLAKRTIDFIFKLDREGELDKIFNKTEIKYVYNKFNESFNKIIKSIWDEKNELLIVKDADSWMDTIKVEYPLDVQVQFLEFISSLSILAGILDKKEDSERFLEVENLLRQRIREGYFRNGNLYAELNEDRISSHTFFAYYTYPDLFLKSEWEQIFDKALMHLRTSWGGISSLSNKDSRFIDEYSGENNNSYHNGDSWFWINNMTALVLEDLNEKKYRSDIRKILTSSVKDILRMGCIGYHSEISSAKEQRAEGCFAQAWSSAMFIELCDRIFNRIH